MSNPLVSVMLPTFNQVDYVAEAMSSALEQDYDPLQVVVADDGSTDGTIDLILEYAQRNPGRLVPLVNGPHLGITGNCNRSLRACQGKYIAFHAGDDVFLPGKIKRQVEWMEADARRVLCGHDVDVFEDLTGKTLFLTSKKLAMRYGKGAHTIVNNVPFGGVSIMVRASAIPPYGFDERLSIISDRKLWIDCLASGGMYGYIKGVYARYRRHGNNTTNVANKVAREQIFVELLTMLALVEASYPHLIQACRKARANFLYRLGAQRLVDGDRKSARSYLASAIGYYVGIPWKGYLSFLVTFTPKRVFDSILPKMRMMKSSSL